MSNALAEIAAYKKKIAALEKQLTKGNRKLLALPAKFGFKNVSELIQALEVASKASAAAAPAGRSRAKITDETKAKVKELAEAGKSGAEIAAAVGISLPSVQNIKKALGLVKARKAKK